jgi:hypothetical protein
MNAEWNVHAIAAMDAIENLRNACYQLEQQYVDWHHTATHRGCCVSRQWPAIGELGRWQAKGALIEFVTTRKRSILIKDSSGILRGEVVMARGMGEALYKLASAAAREVLAVNECGGQGKL